MEQYTELEQALRDSSLVLIPAEIGSLKALGKTYLRYKVLPKRQKRLSDYYSNVFFGYRVPEMYELMKDKLLPEGGPFGDWQGPAEKYLLSEPDLYYREDSFNAGETNICWILGHSGSGKSMMARSLEGDRIDHIELDDLLLTKDHFTMEELRDYSDLFYAFFAGEGAKYYVGAEERDRIPKEAYEDRVFPDFVSFAMDYAGQHRDKKYIIDGIWIYLYFDDPSMFEDYAVFIKGTSFLKSKLRAAKREMQRDKESLQDRKQMFGREVRNYLLDEDKINRYRDFFGARPETVFRAETDEAAKQEELVRDELNRIDEGFVKGDAEAIREIREAAETNPGLSAWNRQRIVLECVSALIDLRIPGEDGTRREP